MAHRLRDLNDLAETIDREMHPSIHHLEDESELLEVLSLRRSQWVLVEKRNDPLSKIAAVEDRVDHGVFPVIVTSPVAVHLAAPEELSDHLESLDWLHLPAQAELGAPMDWAANAAFTVDEADDPLLDPRPFLLIARTRRFVTDHGHTVPGGTDMIGTAGSSGFPAYSQLHSHRRRCEGQSGVGILPSTLGPL